MLLNVKNRKNRLCQRSCQLRHVLQEEAFLQKVVKIVFSKFLKRLTFYLFIEKRFLTSKDPKKLHKCIEVVAKVSMKYISQFTIAAY